MLRHFFQHIEVGAVGFVILWLITHLSINFKNIGLFIVASYIPDLDGISSVFIWQSTNEVANVTANLLLKFKIKEALAYATIHHKKLNRLVLHNLVVYPLIWISFVYALQGNHSTLSIILAALLSHFTFDICDDLYQLGHIKNWLWPYSIIFPKAEAFKSTNTTNPLKNKIPSHIKKWMI